MEHQERIGHEIRTLSNMIKRRIDQAAVFSDNDAITGMHGWIIGYLYHHREQGDIFQRDIETEFSIRRSTATGILQLMEKNDLIIREPVNYDARLKKLVLTPKAIAIHEEVITVLDEIEKRLSENLTQEELITFFSLIRKMKKSIE